MFIKSIHIDKIKKVNLLWLNFVEFCKDKLSIQKIFSRNSISIEWLDKNKSILEKQKKFLYNQNINSNISLHSQKPIYILKIYNVFDIKFIFDEISKHSERLKNKVESYYPILAARIKNHRGCLNLKPLQIEYIKNLYRQGKKVKQIIKLTGHCQKAINKIIFKAFDIKPTYIFMGKKVA